MGQKSKKSFSKLGLDQMHEQLIAVLKGDGGIIGVTENANALRRLLVSGPEFSRMIQEFENNPEEEKTNHHEHSKTHSKKMLQILHRQLKKWGTHLMRTLEIFFK